MNTQKITIKELSSKLEAINPRGKKWVHKDTAQIFQRFIRYAAGINKIGGKMEQRDNCIVFIYKNGTGKIPANDPDIQAVLLPYLTQIFKA